MLGRSGMIVVVAASTAKDACKTEGCNNLMKEKLTGKRKMFDCKAENGWQRNGANFLTRTYIRSSFLSFLIHLDISLEKTRYIGRKIVRRLLSGRQITLFLQMKSKYKRCLKIFSSSSSSSSFLLFFRENSRCKALNYLPFIRMLPSFRLQLHFARWHSFSFLYSFIHITSMIISQAINFFFSMGRSFYNFLFSY